MQTGESGQSNEQQAIHASVHGLVQGVGFRNFAKLSAQRLGVAGWVRNADDGTVEVWAEGSHGRLQQFIQVVRRGPTYSMVTKLDLSWGAPTGEYRTFHIRY